MPRVKVAAGTAKKASAKVAAKKSPSKSAASKKPSARKPRSSSTSRAKAPRKPVTAPATEVEISAAQDQVVASKFVGPDTVPSKLAPRPTLPGSYGESHLLLLVRDPQTLFAAWDASPSTVDELKARIGARALAVSTLTLRLFREGGLVTVFHVIKKARSRYIKIDGNSPSFVAEIGFTTPAGRFELIARSAPCFVPMGLAPKAESRAGRRAVIGYREARAIARRALAAAGTGARGRVRRNASIAAATSSASASTSNATPRVLGGASDLYRR